ncbi:MAG: pyruvate, water dikinase regulatory protein [Anaerolineae bacterium]
MQTDYSGLEGDWPPVYVVSGGTGASGERLAQTALAQFPEVAVPIIVFSQVCSTEEIERIVNQAAKIKGTILHTLVDVDMRRALIRQARDKNVFSIDLVGRVLHRLANVLEQEPINQPGQYWLMRQAYFERIEAIEYTINHDDGLNPDGWSSAEIVLVGVSRVGKTPLSVYLSTLGWKVANLPLLKDVPLPPQLLQLDRRRIVGLSIEPGQLLLHRKQRQHRLGTNSMDTEYTDALAIYEEVDETVKLFRRHGFAVVNVTDKPIEESADEVIALVTRRLQSMNP